MAEKTKPGLKDILANITKSFRDMKGEMKKVVWSSKKQIINNTSIVLMFMVAMSVIIGAFDSGLTALIRLFFGISS